MMSERKGPGERMAGKTVLITGAAQGIGAAHAHVFAAEGASLVIGDVAGDLLEALAEELGTAAKPVVPVQLDVTSEADWQRAVRVCNDTFGGLTTLINNAGIYAPLGLEEETADSWARTIAVNQTGVFLGMQTCMPTLRQSKNAAIVNIASLLGLIGSYKATAYHASKGAVRVMSKATAIEYARHGVRVNSIYPGSIETPIIANMSDREKELTSETIPLGRWGRPEDIAYASLFLCSDEASYITGTEINVDGGYCAK